MDTMSGRDLGHVVRHKMKGWRGEKRFARYLTPVPEGPSPTSSVFHAGHRISTFAIEGTA